MIKTWCIHIINKFVLWNYCLDFKLKWTRLFRMSLKIFFILTVKVGQVELNIKQNKPLTWSVVPNEPAKGIHAMLNTQPTK